MTILIIAEHNNTTLNPATLNTITAAKAIGGDIHVLVAGTQAQAVANEAVNIAGVSKVLLADDVIYQHALAENLSNLIITIAPSYSHILTAATTTGKNVLPRVAALLDVDQISDIISVESADTFKRPVFTGNAIATVKCTAPIKVITVRTTAFDATPAVGGQAVIETLAAAASSEVSAFVSESLETSSRPDVTSARVVVGGGRGVQSAENFEVLYALADKLGGAVGATRAAVDAGYIANDLQIGQTGKIIAPELYIAAGISGAIQHTAGVKDSKVIVAINKDADAPIFQIADYGLVGDLLEIIPELTKSL